MELITLLLIVILVIIFIQVMPKASKPLAQETVNKVVVAEQPTEGSEVVVVVEKPVVDESAEIGEFPYPQPSTSGRSLSPNFTTDLDGATSSSKLPSEMVVSVLRTTVDDNTSHYPEYYRKDTMSGDTLDTTELSFVETVDEPAYAWSDKNVSQYPKYYKSNFPGGLTNVGAFFDQNNKYVDLTGPRAKATPGEVCYVAKGGDKVCLENGRLQNVAPDVTDDGYKCGIFKQIGQIQNSFDIIQEGERVINGGNLYGGVSGSMNVNETFSEPIQPQVLACSV